MSNTDQYPYEPSRPRSRRYFYLFGIIAALLAVIVVIAAGMLLTQSESGCDGGCSQATEISSTNFAVETAIGASQTAVSATASAQTSFQATPTSNVEVTAIASPPLLPEIAAIPVRVVVVGEEIGIGTIRLFAPQEASYPETVRVELDLQLSQQIWTATPELDTAGEIAAPGAPAASEPFPTQAPPATQPPPGTPTTTPNYEERGLTVFQKMGASLFCLESSFTGCDTASDPAKAQLITDLGRGVHWSWVIRPGENITGQQDLQVVLWRLVVADNGPPQADEVWSHFFQINTNPQLSQPESNSNILPIVVIVAIVTALLVMLAFLGTRLLHVQKKILVGPKVFISYRRRDTWAVARNLYDQLESHGARVFLDVKDINEGRFAEIIETNIERCEYFIPVLGPDTLNSTWVRREIATAIAHDKIIIPVLVGGFSFDSPLPEDIKDLESHNSITLLPEYLDAAIARLLQFMHLNAS